MRRVLKKLLSDMLFYLLWAVIAIMIWMWIFILITDTSADKKVVLFADVPVIKTTELSVELEKDKPENIKMIKTYAFSYAMMSSNELAASDLYIIGSASIDKYIELVAPLSGEYEDSFDAEFYERDGVKYGIKVYDMESGEGIASDYIAYLTNDDYYLFFNKGSAHAKALGYGEDDAALEVAKKIFELK